MKWITRKKTSGKNNPVQTQPGNIPLSERWKEGLEASYVHYTMAQEFLSACMEYYADMDRINSRINEHNDQNDMHRKHIEDLLAGKKQQHDNVGKLLMSVHKECRNSVLEKLEIRKKVFITAGAVEFACLNECYRLRPDASILISKEDFTSLCQNEIISEYALKNIALSHKAKPDDPLMDDYHIPTRDQLSFYYDVTKHYYELTERDRVDEMFTPEGLIMLPDESGIYRLAEENILDKIVEIDYKGIV